jgi:hypothetical protein
MSTDDKARAQSLVERLLHDAEENTLGREYKEALVAIRKAKALDSSNVYILALERQVEQLQQYGDSSLLSEAQRVEVLESLPGLMQRALSQQTALRSPEEVAAMDKAATKDVGDRDAAEQWLKNQYFQRAHEHVRQGEYQLALWEIRRIYIVDAQDKFAGEFEQRILQLLEMQGAVTPPSPPPAAAEAETEPGRPIRPPVAPPIYQPGMHARTTPPPQMVEDFPKSRRKFRVTDRVLMVAALITLATLCFAFYYFWQREQVRPLSSPPTQSQPVNP